MAASFIRRARSALSDARLQASIRKVGGRFAAARAAAAADFPEFEAFRDAARDIKDHTLANLDLYLRTFEDKVRESGGVVHFASTARDACEAVLSICRENGASSLVKSKSMVSEEANLNSFLEERGVAVTETDLGEYILQLRREQPSHIVAPAAHLSREQIEATFRRAHADLPPQRPLEAPELLMQEARETLRGKFLSAEVGLTGANVLVAETGSAIIVTNEGNADLGRALPKVHIVLTSIEKLVPTLEDAGAVLRVLARSATGQAQTVYTTMCTGSEGAAESEGPRQFHVVLLDGGRSAMLHSPFHDMLRCIKCGACMNHCPVYQAIGGHAYGSVYPGPMGSVLTPALFGLAEHAAMPNASTLCGRCEEVCPVRIPLPRLLRLWREQEFERRLAPRLAREALAVWAFFARRPALYVPLSSLAMRALRLASAGRGRFGWLIFATSWTRDRDMPAPQGASFQEQWRAQGRHARR